MEKLAATGILILVHFMKENYLEKPSGSWNPYPSAFYEGEPLLDKLCGNWNPYPSAFYEGELPGQACKELEILIMVHFMKENYLEKPCRS